MGDWCSKADTNEMKTQVWRRSVTEIMEAQKLLLCARIDALLTGGPLMGDPSSFYKTRGKAAAD